jgi:hypothetical protein
LGNLIFLVGAIGASIVGSVLLWLRYRRPMSFMSSIDDFQAEMTALSAERPPGGKAPNVGQPDASASAHPGGVWSAGRLKRPRGVVKGRRGKPGAPSGRPRGLRAPDPSAPRQGSTVRRMSPPSRVDRSGDAGGTAHG